MIQINYAGESLLLWPYAPNWARRVRSEHELPGRVEAGLSNLEAGHPAGETLRTSLTFTADLIHDEAVAVKRALRAMTTERVAMPFWPAAKPRAEYAAAKIHGGLNISYQVDEIGWPTFSRWEIHTGLAPSSAYGADAQTYTAPLLLGYLDDPGGGFDSDEDWAFGVDFEEDSDASHALQIATVAAADGPALAASTPKLFPLRHDWSRSPKESHTIQLERETLGNGRRYQLVYHGAQSRQELGLQCTFLEAAEASAVLRFFLDRQGTADAFWMCGNLAPTRLTADVQPGDSVLSVEDGLALAGMPPYLALCDREQIRPLKITGTAASSLTLTGIAAASFREDETSICPLLLTRFDRRVIRVQWETDEVGEIDLDLIEVPAAYDPPVGSSIGVQPKLASLYTFTSGGQTWRYTGWERDLSYGGNVYLAEQIEHADITHTLDLNDAVSLTCDRQIAPVFQLWRCERGTVGLAIDLAEVSGETASNARRVFTGEVREPKASGSTLKSKCGLWRVLDNFVPRARFAGTCQWPLYGEACGLLLANWRFTALLTDVGTPGYPFTFTVNSLARENGQPLPASFGSINWFARGYVELNGDIVRIQQSTALSSGIITVTLARDPKTFPTVGDALVLVRGCDGRRTTCQFAFDNYANWGGALVATGNLSLLKVDLPSQNSGAKK
ncbi:MAG: phage BR0599 family protein [Verrucomicrobiota bacterium JB022]|nr:phage BR0599 family protein [Verrucomicrobiota bacterium JB022]